MVQFTSDKVIEQLLNICTSCLFFRVKRASMTFWSFTEMSLIAPWVSQVMLQMYVGLDYTIFTHLWRWFHRCVGKLLGWIACFCFPMFYKVMPWSDPIYDQSSVSLLIAVQCPALIPCGVRPVPGRYIDRLSKADIDHGSVWPCVRCPTGHRRDISRLVRHDFMPDVVTDFNFESK